jgi:thioredoxin reductase (NADPH)
MTNNIKTTKCLIIGSGPAGYTAAIYAARANLKPILVAGQQPGGQLTITTDVENYPGFADIIQGPWLMEQMNKQAAHVGTEIIYDNIKQVDFNKKTFTAIDESGNKYEAKTVIICTGAQAKWLGLPAEKKYMGFGVSGCATCDGFFFKNQDVIVVGGGNTAVEDALYLTNHAKSITLIHRRDELRAEKMLQERLFKHKNVKMLWDHVLEDIQGKEDPLNVTGVKVKNVKTNKTQTLAATGVFIAIGHTPNTKIFQDYLTTDAEGYIKTKPGTATTEIPGIYAAGDVQDNVYRQAVTAAGTGCMAALEAEKYLNV